MIVSREEPVPLLTRAGEFRGGRLAGLSGIGLSHGTELLWEPDRWESVTMLAVASDRFPRTGAVAISIVGGIGMLSAGMLGGPGLGHSKDRFATEALAANSPATYAEVKVAAPSKFLFLCPVNAIDGAKLAAAKTRDEKQATIVAADLRPPESFVDSS